MNILIRWESMASHYVYLGLAKELEAQGHKVTFWQTERNCAFDIFNNTKVDIFLGQGYNLDRATVKCLNLNPGIKCFLKVGAWGDLDDEYEKDKYGILMASDQERKMVDAIQNKDRVTVFNYHVRRWEQYVIGRWLNIVPKIFGFAPAADAHTFYPEKVDPNLKCDIGYCGGFWRYKGENQHRFIIPLCYPIGKYKIRIFGNQHWPVPQYLGFIQDDTCRLLFSSATVIPAVHEPHSNRYGFDILSRVFNVIACRGFTISDYVASWVEDIFTNGELLCFKDPKDYLDAIEQFVKRPETRLPLIDAAHKVVMAKHTYKNRVEEILNV